MTLLKKIQEIRESKKITREEIGKLLYMTGENYKKIEYGSVRLTLETYLEICKILELSPMELLKENEEEHFVLLNNKDLSDLNRIIQKINNQTNNFNNCIGTFNVINNKEN